MTVRATPLRVAAPEVEADVLAHALDDRLGRLRGPELRIEAEAIDDRVQAGSTEDLLADGAKPGFKLTGHRGADEGFRDLLPIHEHRGGGLIEVRDKRDDARGGGQRRYEHKSRQPLPAAPDRPGELQHPGAVQAIRMGVLSSIRREYVLFVVDSRLP
jgi:hypothetical protein